MPLALRHSGLFQSMLYSITRRHVLPSPTQLAARHSRPCWRSHSLLIGAAGPGSHAQPVGDCRRLISGDQRALQLAVMLWQHHLCRQA